MMSGRHVPLRSCVNCGRKAPKPELIRIVATPNGTVLTDPTGKTSGRGAYVCRDASCIQMGIKRGRLAHALRTSIKDEEWETLIEAVPGNN
jgi:predicted RNA-binding protein YlxR (DUF448 family)